MDTDQNARYGESGAIEFRIDCRSLKAFEKNTLRGFVTLKITPPGLVVNDVCLHEKGGRRWLSFPAKPYQDKEGKQQGGL
jgi:hypothetical protein